MAIIVKFLLLFTSDLPSAQFLFQLGVMLFVPFVALRPFVFFIIPNYVLVTIFLYAPKFSCLSICKGLKRMFISFV